MRKIEVVAQGAGSPPKTFVDGEDMTGGSGKPLTIENYSTPRGSLIVEKLEHAEDGTPDPSGQEFNLIVTFTDGTGKDDEYSYTRFDANGVALETVHGFESGDKIFLKGGEYAKITDLPDGLKYKVTEDRNAAFYLGYIPSVKGKPKGVLTETGEIEAGETKQSAFINTRYTPGQLVVSKQVAGNRGDTDKAFWFTLTLADPIGDGAVPALSFPIQIFTLDTSTPVGGPFQIWNGERFMLKHNQKAVIQGLPGQLAYEVVEDNYTDSGYTTEIRDGSGNLITSNGAIAGGSDVTRAFTNTKHQPGELAIQKQVVGRYADSGKPFKFTVAFTGPGATDTYPYVGVNGGPSGNISSGGSVLLSHGQSIVISELPTGLRYKVTEDDYADDGYFTYTDSTRTTVSREVEGVASATGGNAAVFTNVLPDTELIISKTVSGSAGDTNKNFFFTISFDGPDALRKYFYLYDGETALVNQIATGDRLSLKDGQKVKIIGLPVGLNYTVTEDDYKNDGYFTEVNGVVNKRSATDAIVLSGNPASFVNRMYDTELIISKTVSGQQADPDKPFNFTVKFDGLGSDRAYDYIRNNATAPSGRIGNNDTFSLKHGETVKIIGLPVGLRYTVTEADYSADWYAPVQDAEGVIDSGTNSAPFTNIKHLPGELVIQKNVMGSLASTTKEFDFTLTFSGAGSDKSYSYIRYIADRGEVDGHLDHGVLTSGYSFKLAHGQRLVVKALPESLNYEVTEADYSAEKYFIASSENAKGATGATPTFVTFINAISPSSHNPDGPGGGDGSSSGSLTVKKTVTGEDARRDRSFTFVVTFDASGEYSYHGSKRGTISSGESITLAHGESITITGLPRGVAYRVTEQEANKDGYYSTSTGASGTVTASGQTAAFINARGVPFVPPNTGDSTSNTLAILALLASSALLAVLVKLELSLRKKSSKS